MFDLQEMETLIIIFKWALILQLERCNYFLNQMVELARRKEEPEGRLVSFLLQDPICDGGQWDMVANVIKKHGVMPKKCFPESYSCENSRRMNSILKSKVIWLTDLKFTFYQLYIFILGKVCIL